MTSTNRKKYPIFRDLSGVNRYELDDMEPELSVLLDEVHAQYLAAPDDPIVWPKRLVYLIGRTIEVLMSTRSFRNYTSNWRDEMTFSALMKVYKHVKKYDVVRLKSKCPACTFLTFIVGQAIRNSITELKKRHIRQAAIDAADWTVLGDTMSRDTADTFVHYMDSVHGRKVNTNGNYGDNDEE